MLGDFQGHVECFFAPTVADSGAYHDSSKVIIITEVNKLDTNKLGDKRDVDY